MPFERVSAKQRHNKTALLRRVRIPALALVASLAAVLLFEQSSLTRNIGKSPTTNLGWQSFLPAYNLRTATATQDDVQASNSSVEPWKPGSPYDDDDDWGGWWDDEGDGYNDAYDGFLPMATAEIWDPFILNSRPLTEITAKACVWPPSVYDTCMPDSSMKEDAERGQWIRVEKDLNLRIGIYYLYLFYRRLPLFSTAPTVREFRLLTTSEESVTKLSSSDGWNKVVQNIREGVWPNQEPAYLYYRALPRTRASNYSIDEVNELDVIWGSSGTLYGWDRMNQDFAVPKEKIAAKDTDEGAELMWRKGQPLAPQALRPLSFSTNGTYKIVQIADLHFSVGKGKCLDSNWPGCKDVVGSDNVTLQWLGEMLDSEKPDLIILSGDQLNGQDTSYSAESVILKVAHLFEKRSIAWAAVLGNHDSEKTTLTRYGQMVMMQALPYFVGEPGLLNVDGEGNYVLKVYSADESRTPLFTLYFLDSHALASSLNPFSSEYDTLKDSQIQWFKNESNHVKPIERPYSPPILANSTFGLKNDIDLRYKMRAQSRRLTSRLASSTAMSSLKKPNAMAIFHIPLPEVYDEQPDIDQKSGSPLVFGSEEEGRGAPKKNSGFFDKALLAQTELGPVQAVGEMEVDDDPDYAAAVINAKPEVKVILNGHCHVTDECRRIKGIWNCFAGGSSYSGYSKVGFDRRVRVYEISDYGETISTYKIVDGHADASGVSDSSNEDAATDSSPMDAGTAAAAEAEAELEVEKQIEALNKALADGTAGPETNAPRKRQKMESLRKKIDEMVLVGTGAPG